MIDLLSAVPLIEMQTSLRIRIRAGDSTRMLVIVGNRCLISIENGFHVNANAVRLQDFLYSPLKFFCLQTSRLHGNACESHGDYAMLAARLCTEKACIPTMMVSFNCLSQFGNASKVFFKLGVSRIFAMARD